MGVSKEPSAVPAPCPAYVICAKRAAILAAMGKNENKEHKKKRGSSRLVGFEVPVIVIAILSAFTLILTLVSPTSSLVVLTIAGLIFTFSLILGVRLFMDPDSMRARQSDMVLQLVSKSFDLMQKGMTPQAAQGICELLLPNTAAIAVAVTGKEIILGYAGFFGDENPAGKGIRTQATQNVIRDATMRVFCNAEDIGLPASESYMIKAAIIVPLIVGSNVEGTLKFYYRNAKNITETQKSIALGFGKLLATQMVATEADKQRKLASLMELKMLQSQINPHFLFNTINTIASLIRTDPTKARMLLREFATFYRRTLEDSTDRIMLSREIEQTERYFSLEVARFGDDRVVLNVDVNSEVQDMLVPPFIIQPLVENSVRHAMPSEGRLSIEIAAEVEGDDILVKVADDGVGMSEETCDGIMHPESSTGMGIAVKNVHDRMKGSFGSDADMKVESELGKGTIIVLRFPGCATGSADMSVGSDDLAVDKDEASDII